jgi:dipeptidyl aminopeptidase/acylaminoacyl peptidase
MVSTRGVRSQREDIGAATVERVTFASGRGVRLAGLLHRAADADLGGRAAVVLCHGMESTKEGTKHQALAARLAARGYACLRFDFSYVGESEGAFEDLTIGGEVEDLAGACAFVRERGAGPLALVGSSLGGTVALLHAAGDPGVRALATIAAVSRPLGIVERLGARAVADWRARGYREEATGRLKRDFLDDLGCHDVLAAARALAAATLVTHGAADAVVPVGDARALYAALPDPKALAITPGCDHRYSDPEQLAALLERIVGWIATHLPATGDAGAER